MQNIFGSVSTTDMAVTIKELLAKSQDGQRVVVGAEDVKILTQAGKGVEGDRLKALGDFQIEVRVKGGDALQRTVSVRAPEG